jgi:eukaryotic-like serine/threonine-protein kinase
MPPPNRSKVPIGTVLEGKFRVTKEIGRGGMAAVYEAENIDIGKRVAVKILAAELLTSRVVRERFIREARASAAIRSPYICDVYDSGMYEERPFLVMELLEGESLYDLLTRVRQVDIDTTLTVATHACRGLTKAHEMNVVHRDLKPENIFLTHTAEGELIVKLLDFGLAKFYEPTGGDAAQARLTREGALFGTPAYMSPEQAKGQGEVDHRCDLWALGCIVYECLTGQTVWNVDQGVAMILAQIASAPLPRPSRLRPDLPKAFDQWFLRSLDRDPDKRYQTPKAFSEALTDALKPGPSSVREAQLSSDAEGEVVDKLISGELESAALSSVAGSVPVDSMFSRPSTVPAPAPDNAVPQNFDLSPSPTPEQALPQRGSSRAVASLLGVAAVALGTYALWFYVLHPPPARHARTADSAAAAAASASADAGPEPEALAPREHDAYALQIASAEHWLVRGKRDNALAMFHEAFLNGGSTVARALFAHAGVALAPNNDKCQVTGLGRPRPFNLTDSISRPTIALGMAGLVVAWMDSHQDVHRRQGYATVVDSALERVAPARLVTPEASYVRDARLVAAGNKIAFIYWDSAGEEPGVYVRFLDADGRIAAPARRITTGKHGELSPELARAGDGTFWAVWTQELEGDHSDVMATKLNANLEPVGKPVRLTAYARRGWEDSASNADVAIAGGQLYVVFALQHNKQFEVMRLRIALSDPALATGVVEKHGKFEGRSVGDLTAVSKAHAKSAEPRVACTREGCFVVWDDERKGAVAAFLDRDKGQAIWHRDFGGKGSRPNIAASTSGAVVAWYSDARLKVAHITRDGLDKPSVLARESGYQPYPAIVPGSDPGQWYICWRDYEAGHLEAFLVRAQCK